MLKLKFSMLNTECSEDDFTELTCNKEVYYSFGEDDALVIGEFVNDFMKAAGYVFNKDYILMESLDEEELDYLEDCLAEYRERKENGSEDLE